MGRRSKKKEKKDRLSMQNWAEGARETILAAWVSPMVDAMAQGWQAQDQVLRACTNEYHAKFSWRLQDHEEPSLPLPAYDPKNLPVEEELSDADLALKRERVTLLNQRIRRWLLYRIKPLSQRVWSRARRTTDPFALLLAKLSGLVRPPKARQGYQQFMHEKYGDDTPLKTEVEKMYAEDVKSKPALKWNMNYRGYACRTIFNGLPQTEQDGYKKTAADKAVEAKDIFKTALKAPVSERPEDIQSCIDNLLPFIAPILTGIAERTKLQCFFVAGGMIPKADGEIGTKHYSVGSNPSTGVSFTKWKDGQFDTNVLAPFKGYLEGVYLKKDRKKAAIPDPAGEAAAAAAIAVLDEAVVGLGDGLLPDDEEDDEDDEDGDTSSSSGGEASDGESAAGGTKRKRKSAVEMKDSGDGDAKKVEQKKGQRKKGAVQGKHKGQPAPAKDADDEDKGPPRKRPKPSPANKAVTAEGEGNVDAEREITMAISEPETEVDPSWIRPLPPVEVLAMMHESDVDFSDTDFVDDLGRPLTPEPAWSPERPPADCPDWFRVLFEDFASIHFQSYECWSDWNRILADWVELERSYGWKEEGAFSAAARPKEVTQWISGGRTRMRKRPSVKASKTYTSAWWKWWYSLQPEWRKKGHERPSRWNEEEDWESLKVPGRNGMAGILAALFWWAIAADDEKVQHSVRMDWVSAASDLQWALTRVLGKNETVDVKANEDDVEVSGVD
ncbi:hypothetical protein C8J56DRAFT_1052846 [Mycena floridula]|nr:hypothetical protein C8J56DRAFT_1052846 [Mycena floridula]